MTIAIYNPFKSIQEIKKKGELIKKGKIIPTRILRVSKRKLQHAIVAGCDMYAFSTNRGYVVLCEPKEDESVIRILKGMTCEILGSPYGGETQWCVLRGNEDTKYFNEAYTGNVL